jgi:hypothetical protein
LSLVFLGCGVLAGRADVITWVNGAGGNWSVAANWSPNRVPGPADDVLLNGAGNYTVTEDGTNSVNSLTLSGGGITFLVLSNRTFDALGGFNVSAGAVVDAGTINCSGLDLSGGAIYGPGLVSLSGSNFWTGGVFTLSSQPPGTLALARGAAFTIAGTADHDLPGWTFNNSGTVIHTGGRVRGGYGSVVNNGGFWVEQADQTFNDDYGNGPLSFVNSGIFRKTAGSGATTFPGGVPLSNNGLVDVESGTVLVSGGGASSGTFNAATNAVCNFNNSFTFNDGTAFTGAGLNLVSGGGAGFYGAIASTNLQWAGANIGGGGVISGSWTWTAGYIVPGSTLTVATHGALSLAGNNGTDYELYGVLTNAGTIRLVSGNLRTRGDSGEGNVVNAPGGLVDLAADVSLDSYSGGSIINQGTLRKSGGSGAASINTALYNYGTVDAQSGTIAVNSGGSASGAFIAAAGASCDFDSSFSFMAGAAFGGAGTNLLASGNMSFSGSILCTNLYWGSGANIFGTPTIPSGNQLYVAGASNGNNDLFGSLTNAGAIRVLSGTLRTRGDNGAGDLVNAPGGLVDLPVDVSFSSYSGGSIINQGTLRKSGGSGISYIYTALYNYGTVDAQSGMIAVNSGGSASGAFIAGTGATCVFGNSFSFMAGAAFGGAGTNLLGSGNMTFSGSLLCTNLYWGSGANIFGALTIPSGNLFYVAGAGNGFNDLFGSLTNAGAIRVVSGTLRTRGDNGAGNLVNAPGGLVDLLADVSLSSYSGGSVINQGTLRKSGGSGTSSINTVLYNYGTVDAQSGTVAVSSGGSASGAFNAAAKAVCDFPAGYTFTDGASFGGAGAKLWSGGTMSLSGNLAATNLQWVGAMLSGTWAFAQGSTVYIVSANNHDLPGAKLLNYGTIVHSGGAVRGGYGAVIGNEGLWQEQVDSDINNAYGGAASSFLNNGTLVKSGTAGTTTFEPNFSFTDGGTLDAESGVVAINGGYTHNQATFRFGAGSPTNYGQVSISGAVTLAGGMALALLNGYVPATNDVLTPLSFGSGSGAFTSFDLAPLSGGKSWKVSYNAASVSLSVQGQGTNDTLQISGTVLDMRGRPVAGADVFALPGAALTNIVNGSFEAPSIGTTAWVNYGIGSTNIPGWTVIGAAGDDVQLVSKYYAGPAEDGNQYLDPGGSAGGAGVSQTFSTVAGQGYGLFFYEGAQAIHGINPSLGVTIGTNFSSFGEPTAGSGLHWTLREVFFTATSNLTTVAFTDLTGRGDNDNFVDDVVLAAPDYNSVLGAVTDSNGHYQIAVANGMFQVGLNDLPALGYNNVPALPVTVSNASVVVNFTPGQFTGPSYTVALAANPPGAGTAAGGGTFVSGSTITVEATPVASPPYIFVNWTESGVLQSTSPDYSFEVERSRELVANFTLPLYSITARNNPAGAGTISGAGDYYYGTTNLLTATAAFGYAFSNWTEGATIVGKAATLQTIVTTNHAFTANYAAVNLSHVVTTATQPPGLARVAGAGTYANGDTANFSAPASITNAPYIYTFAQFTLSNTVASTAPAFSKTFSTLDPTNLQYVAVYSTSTILPVLINVTANFRGLVPATTNFILALQFDRIMNTNVRPALTLTNPAATLQPTVPTNGQWSSTALANDTYAAAPITFRTGMDGTNTLWVSGAQDPGGKVLALTNAASFLVDATPPPNPVLSITASNSTSAVASWTGYAAPPDLNGFRVYLQATNFSDVAGVPVLTGLGPGARSVQFVGLALDTPYYAAVQALDVAGNGISSVTPLRFVLPTSLPPPVIVQVTPTTLGSALVGWPSYNTASLLGFAGFRVYSAQASFSSVAGLTPIATLDASAQSYPVTGLDRSKTYYFAVVGFNGTNGFNARVSSVQWSDPLSGNLAANLTVGGPGQSVATIYHSIVVVSNATLTILPGTTLLFAPGTSLTVQQGALAANGTALAPIVLDSANDAAGSKPAPGDWGGVLLGSGAGASSLNFVEILYGGGLSISGCAPAVQALTAGLNALSGLALLDGATLTTSNALLTANGIGLQQSDTAVATIGNSVIQNNGTNALAAGSAALNASGNWWGTMNAREVAGQVQGNVLYNPILSYEPVLTPAAGTVGGVTQVGSDSVNLQLACRTASQMRLSEDYTFPGVFFQAFTNFASFPLSAGGGFKHIFIQFSSLTGQTNAPIQVDVTYITTGPVINALSLTEGQTLNRPLTVTGSATAVLGMEDVELYVDGVLAGTNAGGNLSQYLDVRPLNNATHQVEMLARDTAGNIATLEEDVVVAATPPPPPVITSPAADLATNTDSLAVSGTAEPRITVRLVDNGQVLGATNADNSGSFTLATTSLVEGVNTLIVAASDNTGTTPSAALHVTVETLPPAALVMNQPVYNIAAQGLSLAWQFAPTGKRASTFQLFWGLSPFTATNQATGQSPPLTAMSDLLQGLAPGTYYIGVVGYDAVGNPSPLSALVPAVYDPTPPELTVSYNVASPVGAVPVLVTLISSKALAATPTLTLRPFGAASPTLMSLTNVALNTWQTVFAVTPATPSGFVTVAAAAQDRVGNPFVGIPGGPPLIVDTTPPGAMISTLPPAPVQTTNSVTVSVSVVLTKPPGPAPILAFTPPTGSGAPVALTGAGTNWSGTLALTPAMGSGFGQFAYRGQDNLGNLGSNILSGAQLELYNTALPLPPPAPGGLAATSQPGGYVSLTWNAVGTAQIYRLYREPGTNLTLPATLVQDNLASNSVVDLPPADGLYSYGVSASRFGSESALSNVVVALSDRTPPPAPTNVIVSAAASGVQITWQEPAGGTPDHYAVYRNGAVIGTVSSLAPVIDYPPRGTNSYIVAAVDAVGNQSASAPVLFQLLVSPVDNLSVLVAPGQTPELSWSSSDTTVAGFNVYRNGIRQNGTLLSSAAYVDNLPLSDALQYGVTAVNAASQESPARLVTVCRVGLGLLVNATGNGTNNPLLINYFDQFQVQITNLSSSASLPLAQVAWNRAVPGLEPLEVTQTVTTNVGPGTTLQQSVIVPEASLTATQTLQVSLVQQTGSAGSSVTYQQTFTLGNVRVPGAEMAVSVNQLPLAGGLTPFQVQIFNRSYVPIQVIVARASFAQPGDVYISVRDGLGQEASRTPFGGSPPGTSVLGDGTAYVSIPALSSIQFTVPGVLVPASLAGVTNVSFVGVASAIYNQLGTTDQTMSGPLSGTVVSSLALPPYYGTLETDKMLYANAQPIVMTGQAISQATGKPVPNAALNIGFATRGYKWHQAITTDTNGNYQYVYNAPPGFGGTLNLWAAHPLVVDQLNQAQVILYNVYANPSSADIEMSKNGTLDFSIQLINPGDLPLTGFTTSFAAYQVSGTNQIPLTKITGTNLAGAGLAVGPGQSQTINLRLAATIDAPDTAQVAFTFTSAEGAAVTFSGAVSLFPAVPVLSVLQPAAGYLESSLNRGDQVTGQIVIKNTGLTDLKGITLLLPTNNWIAVNLPVSANGVIHLPDLPVGQSNAIGVVFSPPVATPLAFYSDSITVQGTNMATPFSVGVYALVTSDLTGGMQFYVDDILGEALSGASIRLRNNLISANLGPFYTDTNGLVTVTNLEEGSWNWQASAPGCSSSDGAMTIIADQTGYTHARLSRSLVTINFSVVPVPFSDNYTIQISQTYETFVPFPVLVLTPPVTQFNNVSPGFQASYTVTLKNAGLIQMEDCNVTGGQDNMSSLQPLITYMPVVLPQQSIDIPFVVNFWGATNGPGPGIARPGVAARGRLGGHVPKGEENGPPAFLEGCLPGDLLGNLPEVMKAIQDYINALAEAVGRCPTDGTQVPISASTLVALLPVLDVALSFEAMGEEAESCPIIVATMIGCIIGNLLGPGPIMNTSGQGPGSPQSVGYTDGGCLAPDTLVLMGDGKLKPISDLKANERVRSGERSDNLAVVMEVYSRMSSQARQLTLAGPGGAPRAGLTVTAEHLLWVDGKGWTAAARVGPGDWLFDSHGRRVRVIGNEPLGRSLKVYSLRLAVDNAFYANDLLVHDLCGLAAPVAARKATGTPPSGGSGVRLASPVAARKPMEVAR